MNLRPFVVAVCVPFWLRLCRVRYGVPGTLQAHYDLMLAQTVAFQIKAFEYRALMAQIIQKPPVPSKLPTPDLTITFVVDTPGSHWLPRI